MAYAERLVRCNITGILGAETVVHTVWMQYDASGEIIGGQAGLQAVADRVRNRWTETVNGGGTNPPGIGTFLATQLSYTKVSAYRVGTDGKATAQAESLFTTVTKGTNAAQLPLQCALVVSLKTRVPGRSGRGRLYLGPLGTNLVDTNGRVTDANRDAISLAMAGFYTRLRDEPGQPDSIRPVIASRVTGQANKITDLSVGNIIDTQRSRRSALVETRSSRVVDPS